MFCHIHLLRISIHSVYKLASCEANYSSRVRHELYDTETLHIILFFIAYMCQPTMEIRISINEVTEYVVPYKIQLSCLLLDILPESGLMN